MEERVEESASKLILEYNSGREPERLKIKLDNMAEDLFTFFRGSCHLFVDRMEAVGGSAVHTAVLAWCSGDLHLENFGTFNGDNGLAYFDVNDFDEASKQSAGWEILRLATSILIAQQKLGIDEKQAHELADMVVCSYLDALSHDQVRWLERDTATGPIGDLLKGLMDRKPDDKLKKNTDVIDGKRVIKMRKKHALPASLEDRAYVNELIEHYAAGQPNPSRYAVLDVARRIAGTGSLGLKRWIIVTQGKGSSDENWLLDLKEIVPSSLATRTAGQLGGAGPIWQPQWNSEAERVVTLQRRCQAAAPALLAPLKHASDGKSYVLRDLQPTEDRLDLDALAKSPEGLRQSVADMGRLAAWAQLRASGRQGAPSADLLVLFASGKGTDGDKWARAILDAATTVAGRLRTDWDVYRQAYKAGYFAPILGQG
jgi:uncharacterized protein (DUF2252 family)